MESSYGSAPCPPNSSLTRSPVSKPSPGRNLLNEARCHSDTLTSSIVDLCQENIYMYVYIWILFLSLVFVSFLVSSKRGLKKIAGFGRGGYRSKNQSMGVSTRYGTNSIFFFFFSQKSVFFSTEVLRSQIEEISEEKKNGAPLYVVARVFCTRGSF